MILKWEQMHADKTQVKGKVPSGDWDSGGNDQSR